MEEFEILQIIGNTAATTALTFGITVGFATSCKVCLDCLENIHLKRKEAKHIGTFLTMPSIESSTEYTLDTTGIKKEAVDIIDEFTSTMTEAGIDISNLIRNFSPYSLEESRCDCGSYDYRRSVLLVNKDNLRDTLIRALLDTMSTYTSEAVTIKGFEVINFANKSSRKKVIIENFGIGISEAYKDVLLERYFGITANSKRCKALMSIVMMIEDIIGQKEMEKSFFNGKLIDLIYHSCLPCKEMERWVKSFDRIHLSWINEINCLLPKLDILRRIGNLSYRALFIEVAKRYIDSIATLASEPDTKELAQERIKQMNKMLEYRINQTLPQDYGITESDVDAIKEYGDIRLSAKEIQKSHNMKIYPVKKGNYFRPFCD